MIAQVVYVGKCTLEGKLKPSSLYRLRIVYMAHLHPPVEINVTLERADGEVLDSHSGYFTLLNCNEAGWKRPIITGLTLDEDDQDSLRRYMHAKERRALWKKWKTAEQEFNEGKLKAEEEAMFSLDD